MAHKMALHNFSMAPKKEKELKALLE